LSLPENNKSKMFSNTSFINGYPESIEFDHFLIDGFNEFYEMKVKEEKERSIKREAEAKRAEELRKIQEEQANREAKSVEEFNLLKKTYGVNRSSFTSITSRLYLILIKLESMESLDEEDIQWLEINKLFMIIAKYYEKEYLKMENLWDLVKASRYFRRAKEAPRAIELLGDKNSNDSKLMSAILTTRGGAYRDINDVVTAETCANKAISIYDKSSYPFNLLGAIYYQKGMPEEGDKCFYRAIELGSNSKIMDNEIQNSLINAGEDERTRVAKYLLAKDGQKYRWAKKYVS